MTVDRTAHFRFGIPDFDSDPWHSDLEEAIRAIDTIIYDAVVAQSVAPWANSTIYTIGSLVIDPADGRIWTCAIAHTSPASPTTFTSFRNSNPTYWNATANIPQQRGTWTTATAYTVGDFVIDSSRYAVCIVSHTSGTFNTDLAAGKWSVLVDLSNLGVGFNVEAEASVASASTVDIGAETPTRLLLTGGTTINSYGTVANTYKILRFATATQVNHDATKINLVGNANRTYRTNDYSLVASNSAGVWFELLYTRDDGRPATDTEQGFIELATNTEAQALTDTGRAITPASLGSVLTNKLYAPSGTRMIFNQTSAPTGWTKDTGLDNYALRIVSGTVGTGGSVNFSTLFGRTATDAKTLSSSELPVITPTFTGSAMAGHAHTIAVSSQNETISVGATAMTLPGGSTSTDSVSAGTPAGTISSFGSGSSFTMAIDMRVKYADVIIAQKD